MVMRRSDHVLIELKSQHEENRYRWDSAQGLGEQVRITWKNGWKGSSGTSLLRIYYLIDLHDASCKTCPFMPMQSRNNDKIYSNSECKCSIAMIMMHPRDGWLQCQCNKMMDEMVHMTRCICHDAVPMMHTPWCKNDDALDVCMYEMHKIWCIHTWVCDAHNATRVLWLFPRD